MGRSTVRRSIAVLGAAVAFVALSGCVPTPVPIRFDGDTGKTTSKAEWRVAAVTTSKGPGIELRMRNCSTVVISATVLEGNQHAHLRPSVLVRDAKGKVFFSTFGPAPDWVQPAGSKIIDTKTPTTDDLQRIIVPTQGASGALTVEPVCTTYPGSGMGPAYEWRFKPCTTTTRSCATRKAGTGTFRS